MDLHHKLAKTASARRVKVAEFDLAAVRAIWDSMPEEQKSAVIGSLAGGTLGAVASGRSNRLRNTLLGLGLGGASGLYLGDAKQRIEAAAAAGAAEKVKPENVAGQDAGSTSSSPPHARMTNLTPGPLPTTKGQAAGGTVGAVTAIMAHQAAKARNGVPRVNTAEPGRFSRVLRTPALAAKQTAADFKRVAPRTHARLAKLRGPLAFIAGAGALATATGAGAHAGGKLQDLMREAGK